MFRDAFAIARQFTFPVIQSVRSVGGKCSAGIGAFVVINKDGWIATAGHVLEQGQAASESATKCREREVAEVAVRADQSLTEMQRRGKLKALGKSKGDEINRASMLWGNFPGNPQPETVTVLSGVDFAIAKLTPFDPAWVPRYPIFKDPSKGLEQPGVSLCKLGYPFHQIVPSFDPTRDEFHLPAGSIPIPFFPIDGIFTRVAHIVVPGAAPSPIPLKWVETSTPGLRGQSGGPTFDTKGTVWAIQTRTTSMPLGFDSLPTPQYFHVGLGVHPETMFALFKDHGISFEMSSY